MPGPTLRALLSGGDRRSIGHVPGVVTLIQKRPRLRGSLVALLCDDDPLIRMRAADALEKLSHDHPVLLQPYKRDLLDLLEHATQQELRWHLAQMVPRLPLTAKQRTVVGHTLEGYLRDPSRIVRTFALQALADLAGIDAALRPRVRRHLQTAARNGTPAMRARARRLLTQLSRR